MGLNPRLRLMVLAVPVLVHALLLYSWMLRDAGSRRFNSYASHRCVLLRHMFLSVTSAQTMKQQSLIKEVRELMNCPHKLNITQREQYRVRLRFCCNATGGLILTQQNTQLGQKIKYESNQKITKTVDKDLFNMLPQSLPWGTEVLGRCAVVGNGGILQNSSCGAEIDNADFIIRFNLGPVSNHGDVGNRTSLMTINPSQIRVGYPNLKKNPQMLANRVSAYGDALLLMPPFAYPFCTELSLAVHRALQPLRPNQNVVFFNPDFLLDLGRSWRGRGLKEPRLSTGLMLASVAMELCDQVHLYGFWPFPMDLSEKPLPHHYYDNVEPSHGMHAMPKEFLHLLQLHSKGALQLHLGPCP